MLHLEFSPIKGPEGNIEYLMHIRKNSARAQERKELTEKDAEIYLDTLIEEKSGISYSEEWNTQIKEIVDRAHENLDKQE